MRKLRKTIYLCRAPLCKHQNIVFEWVYDSGQVKAADAWRGACGGCGRGSFDVQFQKELDPSEIQEPFSTLGE